MSEDRDFDLRKIVEDSFSGFDVSQEISSRLLELCDESLCRYLTDSKVRGIADDLLGLLFREDEALED